MQEVRVEVVVPPADLEAVVAALRGAHPYEEVAFDVYPRVAAPVSAFGMGRIGTLPSPMTQVHSCWGWPPRPALRALLPACAIAQAESSAGSHLKAAHASSTFAAHGLALHRRGVSWKAAGSSSPETCMLGQSACQGRGGWVAAVPSEVRQRGRPSTRLLHDVQDRVVAHVKKALGLRTLMVAAPHPGLPALFGASGSGDNKPLSCLALCAGSGSSLLDRALQAGADVFLTGAHPAAVRHSPIQGCLCCTACRS